jgi:hypothetical protein
MCFSASASFIAGVSLTAAGAVSMSMVKKPSHSFFAAIPLLFGIQQICEGFLWLSFSDPDFASWHTPAKYAFLIFAQVIWPVWIPISFHGIEPSPLRKPVLRYFIYAGIGVTLLLIYRLLFFTAVASIDGCHINYDIASPKFILVLTGILYLLAIVVAPFFSSWTWSKILASVNLASLIITHLFFEVYFVSVWCFFAAAQSVLIIMVMREMKKAKDEELRMKS